jgi:hypothetical protein
MARIEFRLTVNARGVNFSKEIPFREFFIKIEHALWWLIERWPTERQFMMSISSLGLVSAVLGAIIAAFEIWVLGGRITREHAMSLEQEVVLRPYFFVFMFIAGLGYLYLIRSFYRNKA